MQKVSFKKLSLKRLPRLFPPSYNANLKKTLIRWLLLGLLLRLALMPITAQQDLINNYVFSHFIVKHNVYDIYSLRNMSPQISLLYPPFAYYFMAATLLVFDPILPSNYCQVFDKALSAGLVAENLSLESRSQLVWSSIMRDLGNSFYIFAFLVKLPMFFFDFGCAFILIRLLEDHKKAGIIFKFWMFNPVVIVATYMQGQFDIIFTFFILLSMYFFKNQKLNESFFVLGLSIAFKLFSILFIPFYLLFSNFTYKNYLKLKSLYFIILAMSPFLLSVLPFYKSYFFNLQSWQFSVTSPFSLLFKLSEIDLLFPFALIYTIFLLYAWQNLHFSYISLTKYVLSVLLAYYALSYFHPQYFVWAIPFILLLIVDIPNFTKYFTIQLLTFFIYTFNWGRYYALNFFTPINPAFFEWLSPKEIIAYYCDPTAVIGIARSIFSGISFWMIWEMMKKERKMFHTPFCDKNFDDASKLKIKEE